MRDEPLANRNPLEKVEPPIVEGVPSVDGYTIERELGRGGEAIVYLARKQGESRRVAIKVLRADLAASIQTDRFVREIEITADLVHPNILPLLHSGRANGRPYYVAPYIEGESLRAYLQREGQLRVVDAVRIVREVAYALDYACRRHVVHRDIKPENILLADGHAVVADFGVARALTLAGETRLTAKGLVVGTPRYMSPEQAGGESRIDGRSDIYSLACVLYELLAGGPPFRGNTPQQIFAQHLAASVPSLRIVRPAVPRALEAVILTALAKTPADRFGTAAEFGDALASAMSAMGGWKDLVNGVFQEPRVHRVATMLGVAVMLSAGAVLALAGRPETDPTANGRANGGSEESDAASLRLAVLAVDGSDAQALRPAGRLMREALKRWSDVTVEDELRVAEALGTRRAPLRIEEANRVASSVGAGRYVRVSADRVGDTLNIAASLYDVQSSSRVSEGSIRVASNLANAEYAFAALADTLLLPRTMQHARVESAAGTRSLRARDAYLRGHAALADWNLPLADSQFAAATQRDPQYARALLWMGLVRNWRALPVPVWQSAAVRANAGRSRLEPADTLASDALLALADGKTEQACDLWRRSTESNAADFAAWYAYANCLRRDAAVVPDPTQPTKWRFRSNYNTALEAYRRAFRLYPSIGAFNDLARVLKINSTQVREGRELPPGTGHFRAYASVDGDSIVFIPFPASAFTAAHVGVRSERVNAAVLRHRDLYRDIALTWRSASPNNPDAMEAVARSLDLFGDRSAVDTLMAARRIATHPDDRVRLAALEVWMRVKASLPTDRSALLLARALADSVLRLHAPATAPEPRLLSGLASLTGRANLAAAYARAASRDGREQLPGAITETAPALLAFAALGGPIDSLARLEGEIGRAFPEGKLAPGAADARQWLMRAATLAFPEYRSESLRSVRGSSDYMVVLQSAFLRGDTSAVRSSLAALRHGRRSVSPTDLTFDALYGEASVLSLIGDPREASNWLDPTLESLSLISAQVLADADAARAGPLMRAIVLRAEPANRLGDRAAADRYAEAVIILWSDADSFLQPVVNRMRTLTRGLSGSP